MALKNSDTIPVENRQMVETRVFDAPRELVWEAWSDPKQLALWWGPKGFTNTFEEFNFKVGGRWRFVMHGPDGKDYPNESVFVEIVKPERIVLDHVAAPKFRLTATFKEKGGKTEVVWTNLFESVDVYEQVKPFALPGLRENLDRFLEHLAKKAGEKVG
jgi:uncharacterized protein YndB with AHSA1/START domain